MRISSVKRTDLTKSLVDKILFEGFEDTGESGDCIMVLGSSKAHVYRIPTAVQLYQSGRSSMMLLCGGRVIDSEYGRLKEAQIMKHKAIELGVPESAIILEEDSLSTKENMICSVLQLERHFKLCNVKRVLLVSAPYHMRRAMMMARTYMPQMITFVPCSGESHGVERDNWFLSENGVRKAHDEVMKLVSYAKEGSLEDFKIK